MKITKRQLRRIIETSHEETVDMGGESWTRDDLLDAISDYSKELTGRRDRAAIEKLSSAPIEDVAAYYASMSPEAQQDPEFIYATDTRAAETERNVRDAIDAYKPMAKHQGMGRRTESMKITKRQLKRIIKEEKAKLLKEQPRATAMGHTGVQPEQAGQAIVYKLEELEEAIAGVRNPEDWAERKFRSLPAFLENVDRVIAVLDKMQ